MIIINELAMKYGSKLLFTDVSLNLTAGNRYGIVGANGAGKSTLLRILGGEEEASYGQISIPRNARIGWLKQDQFKFEDTRVIDTVIAGKKDLWDALNEKEEILSKGEISEEDGYKLGELEQIIFDNDGYTAEWKASEILIGLGVKEKYHNEPLSVLSGGYKLRVLLAQSLFEDPDILLLDEPTNHLDIESINWLEKYLKDTFSGVLLFISHDLEFLNNTSTHILDIDYGEVRLYVGNYKQFAYEKEHIVELKMHEKNYLEKKVAQMQLFVDRFGAKASKAKQAKSREKMIEKVELPEIEKSSRISPNFYFTQKRLSGKEVLRVNNIHKDFEEKQILKKVSFGINRGEKVIIVGANGIGKSTLLKILMSKLEADNGNFEWGYETHISYFSQDHHDLLNESMSVFQWMSSFMDGEHIGKIRRALGDVLFKKDEVDKDILKLSGGEAARLLLAKIMVEEGNVLVLDEPTNHLDIESKEGLKKALVEFEGTLLMVTHDRDFASSIATRIIYLSEKGVNDYRGTYQEFRDKYGL